MSKRTTTFEFAPHADMQVVGARLKLNGTAAGLAEALKIDPIELEPGDYVHYVGRARLSALTYELVTGTETLLRLHIADNEVITLVKPELVAGVLTLHEERLAEEKNGHSQPALGAEVVGEGYDPVED